MNGRFRRPVVVTLLVALMLGSTGLCEAAMAVAQAAMACCPAPKPCPSHQAPADSADHPVAPLSQAPPCCVWSRHGSVPVLPVQDTISASAAPVPVPPAVLPVVSRVARVALPPRAALIHASPVPAHLLFSVFLL